VATDGVGAKPIAQWRNKEEAPTGPAFIPPDPATKPVTRSPPLSRSVEIAQDSVVSIARRGLGIRASLMHGVHARVRRSGQGEQEVTDRRVPHSIGTSGARTPLCVSHQSDSWAHMAVKLRTQGPSCRRNRVGPSAQRRVGAGLHG
jgi:hypothetical protein